MEALAKAGHVVEPCSEMHDWAVATGSRAERTAMASEGVEMRGCLRCLLDGRRTLA